MDDGIRRHNVFTFSVLNPNLKIIDDRKSWNVRKLAKCLAWNWQRKWNDYVHTHTHITLSMPLKLWCGLEQKAYKIKLLEIRIHWTFTHIALLKVLFVSRGDTHTHACFSFARSLTFISLVLLAHLHTLITATSKKVILLIIIVIIIIIIIRIIMLIIKMVMMPLALKLLLFPPKTIKRSLQSDEIVLY